MRTWKTWVAAAGLMVSAATTAQAALVSLGDGTVKDTNTNLIWLQNWNVNGSANWSTQKAWAEGLDFAGSTDWALPEIDEYAALFNAYGNLTQVALFTNVQFDGYWSGTKFGASTFALSFGPDSGPQGADSPDSVLYAVAVRPNDVTGRVPEPQTLALALLALGATVVARTRRQR